MNNARLIMSLPRHLHRRAWLTAWLAVFFVALVGALRPTALGLAPLTLLPLFSLLILYPSPYVKMFLDYKVAFLIGVFFWSLSRAFVTLLFYTHTPWLYGRSVYAFYVSAMALSSALPLLIEREDRNLLQALIEDHPALPSSRLVFERTLAWILAGGIAVGLIGGAHCGFWGFAAANALRGLYLVLLAAAWSLAPHSRGSFLRTWMFWVAAIFPALFGPANRTALMMPTVFVMLACLCQFHQWKLLSKNALMTLILLFVLSFVGGNVQKFGNQNLISILSKVSPPKDDKVHAQALLESGGEAPAPPSFPLKLESQWRNAKSIYFSSAVVSDYYEDIQNIFRLHYYVPGGLVKQDLLALFPRAYFPSKQETDLSRRAYGAGVIRNYMYEELFLEPALDYGLWSIAAYYFVWLLGMQFLLRVQQAMRYGPPRRFAQFTYVLGCLIVAYSLRGPQIIVIQYLAVPAFLTILLAFRDRRSAA